MSLDDLKSKISRILNKHGLHRSKYDYGENYKFCTSGHHIYITWNCREKEEVLYFAQLAYRLLYANGFEGSIELIGDKIYINENK